jgi:nucleotide-binding universal stress UspA family protein
MRWKKILCPVDFSKPSRHAAGVALELALRFDAEVTLFHVATDPTYPILEGYVPPAGQSLEMVLGEARHELEALRRELDPGHQAEVTTGLKTGAPAPGIVAEASAGEYDLIVMGTNGRTGVKRFLLGSVAELVVRKAPCAVLTVREPEESAAREVGPVPGLRPLLA